MTYRILQGHVLDVLPTLPENTYHTIVTSPPYWGGLRDYEIEPVVWPATSYQPMPGLAPVSFPGDPECEHEWQQFAREVEFRIGLGLEEMSKKYRGGGKKLATMQRLPVDDQPRNKREGFKYQTHSPVKMVRVAEADFDPKHPGRKHFVTSSATCLKCGAWRGNLGNEPTPEMYVAHLVLIFRELRRVMRHDGVFWLNLGDTSAAYWGDGSAIAEDRESRSDRNLLGYTQNERPSFDQAFGKNGIKDGDLIGIPWRVAFALQADGWYLRQDIFWRKLTWTPDSINGWRWERHRIKGEDGERHPCEGCERCRPAGGYILCRGRWRPTRAHEYVFQLVSSPKYFCDREAVRQDPADASLKRINQKNFKNQTGGEKDYKTAGVNQHRSARVALEGFARNPGHNLITDLPVDDFERAESNLTSVVSPKPTPTSERHFAAFPITLPELLVKASTSEKGVCPECGAPWARVIEQDEDYAGDTGGWGDKGAKAREQDENFVHRRLGLNTNRLRSKGRHHDNPFPVFETVEWWPTCKCSGDLVPAPARVLDPFGGSGSTAIACNRLGHHCDLVELSPEYVEIAKRRIAAESRPDAKPAKPKENTGHLSLFDTFKEGS